MAKSEWMQGENGLGTLRTEGQSKINETGLTQDQRYYLDDVKARPNTKNDELDELLDLLERA